jgi:hypothetical protein
VSFKNCHSLNFRFWAGCGQAAFGSTSAQSGPSANDPNTVTNSGDRCCGSFQAIVIAFGATTTGWKLACLLVGAKLPLQATASLSCWQRCELISFVFNGFEIDCIILVYSLPRKPAQNSLGYAADISSASGMRGHVLQKHQKAIA